MHRRRYLRGEEMLLSTSQEISVLKHEDTRCRYCRKAEPVILMLFYSDKKADNLLCSDCAMQLARKLLEDLCAVLTREGRHG